MSRADHGESTLNCGRQRSGTSNGSRRKSGNTPRRQATSMPVIFAWATIPERASLRRHPAGNLALLRRGARLARSHQRRCKRQRELLDRMAPLTRSMSVMAGSRVKALQRSTSRRLFRCWKGRDPEETITTVAATTGGDFRPVCNASRSQIPKRPAEFLRSKSWHPAKRRSSPSRLLNKGANAGIPRGLVKWELLRLGVLARRTLSESQCPSASKVHLPVQRGHREGRIPFACCRATEIVSRSPSFRRQ